MPLVVPATATSVGHVTVVYAHVDPVAVAGKNALFAGGELHPQVEPVHVAPSELIAHVTLAAPVHEVGVRVQVPFDVVSEYSVPVVPEPVLAGHEYLVCLHEEGAVVITYAVDGSGDAGVQL